MPWSIERRRNRYCVIRETDGHNEGCHPTRAEALRHMAALYTAEEGKAMIHRDYEFKGQIESNLIRGAAAVMGNIDDGADVIFPGAFKGGVLDRFLKSGFVSVGHDWGDLPIAMPTKAREVGNALECEAVFHQTPRAQEARTIAMERMAAGLTVGQSIGFEVDRNAGAHNFDTGADLLAYANDNGYDTGLFDTKGIAAHKTACRGITQMRNLFEYSIVPVPMNRHAVATEAKGAIPFADMPLADRDRAWDGEAAEARVREWAGAEESPNAKYRRAFLWYDMDKSEAFGAYKLGYADVIDGELKAVPRALFACAGVMQGARGGVDIPDDDKSAVKKTLERWYARMRKQFDDDTMRAPWTDEGEGRNPPIPPQAGDQMSRVFDVAIISTVRDAERCLRDAGFSKTDAPAFLSHLKAILLRRDAEGDGTADTAKTKDADGQGDPGAAPKPSQAPPSIITMRPTTRIVFSGAGGEVYNVRKSE